MIAVSVGGNVYGTEQIGRMTVADRLGRAL